MGVLTKSGTEKCFSVHKNSSMCNEELKRILDLVDHRKINNPQLWAVGCSFTSADGVPDSERWGQHLANLLGIPVSFLANSAASIQWCADQIIRSDIRPGDTVAWMLPVINRYPYYRLNSLGASYLDHITLLSYDYDKKLNNVINKNVLVSIHVEYIAITCVEQIINLSTKIGFKLVLTGYSTGYSDPKLENVFRCYLNQLPIYKDLSGSFIDIGTDGQHPGPQQHKIYADSLYNFIQSKDLINS